MTVIRRGIRIPIRVKVLIVLVGVLLAAMTTYLTLAITLIRKDRLTYSYDLSQSLADTLSAQARASMEGVAERLRLYGELSATAANAEALRLLGVQLLQSDPNIVRLTLYRRNRLGRLSMVSESLAKERLVPLEITASDMARLDREQPLPLDGMGAERVAVVNRSLPPSAQILSMAVAPWQEQGKPSGWVVAVDMTQERLLSVFAESSLHAAYLVDAGGNTLLHPDQEVLMSQASLAEVPVVAAALRARGAKRGVLDYHAADGRRLLGAWAHVGFARLSVVAEVERERALAATRRLVRLSALFGVGIVLGAFLVAIFFARRLTRPIGRLSQATAELARGHYDVDPGIRSLDEIGDLARDFRQMAQEIRDGQAKLIQSEKMAAFGQLGAGITHEVKNPLGAIRGFAQLALRVQKEPAQIKKSLELIEKETGRCLEIVQNFLRFARRDEGQRQTVALNDLVSHSLRLVDHQLKTSGISIQADYGDCPHVSASPGQLQQVLLNLALNAEQAMERGGYLQVSTRQLSTGEAEIEVRDDGSGIAPEVLPRIFEPFFTTKVQDKGTGLGLSVSYGIIQDHGGTLTVESKLGKGTAFCIRLPPVEAATAA